MNHRNRCAPITLTTNQPIAQFEINLWTTDTFFLTIFNYFLNTFFRRNRVTCWLWRQSNRTRYARRDIFRKDWNLRRRWRWLPYLYNYKFRHQPSWWSQYNISKSVWYKILGFILCFWLKTKKQTPHHRTGRHPPLSAYIRGLLTEGRIIRKIIVVDYCLVGGQV